MTPTPWQRDLDAVLLPLEAISSPVDWPEPETDLEDSLFAAATVVFVEPRRSDRERAALRNAVGGRRFEYLMGLLTFIRAAHYWTVIHPGMAFENDVRLMLDQHEELARLLLEDPEAARCEMGLRLFDELQALRDLNERRELEKAKRALEERDRQRELLLKEVNHRIKNSLQIVSSILQLQLRMVQGTEAAEPMRSASARVLAIASVHERLYKGEDVRSVALHTLFNDLCHEIGEAVGCPDGIACEATPIDVSTDLAIPLALIVNELVTNSVRHVGPPVRVSVEASPHSLRLIVSDDGQGPPAGAREGLGSQMINAFAQQLGATIGTKRNPGSYSIEVSMPLPGPES
jgi:two-component sensor histidine kinase